MLRLSSVQLDRLRGGRGGQFPERLTTHLRSTYGPHLGAWTPEALRDLVNTVLGAADRWGFQSEREIAEVAMLMLEVKLARNPARMPQWFSEIVADGTLHGDAKLYHLHRSWHEQLGLRAPAFNAA